MPYHGDGQDQPDLSTFSPRGNEMPPDVTSMSSTSSRGPALVEDAQPGWFHQHHHPSALHQPSNNRVNFSGGRRPATPPQEDDLRPEMGALSGTDQPDQPYGRPDQSDLSSNRSRAGTDQPENVMEGITMSGIQLQ